jgi:hypothetical protein
MKLIKFSFLLLNVGLFFPESAPSTSSDAVVARAINVMLGDYFAENCAKVDLISFDEGGGSDEAISEKILQNKPDNISIKYSKHSKRSVSIQLETSTILVFESIKYFRTVMKKILWKVHNGLWYKHLVYVPGLVAEDILVSHKKNIFISEVDFLINPNRSSVELATTFFYTKDECGVNQMRTINRFSSKTMRWENSNFYPDKYQNFYGCEIELLHDDFKYRHDLLLLKEHIFTEIASVLNFRLTLKPFMGDEKDDFKNNKLWADVVFLQSYHALNQISSTLSTESYSVIVPAGDPLTDIEKMFAMFDAGTWIAIGFTFAVALVLIQVISSMSMVVQNFVFGPDNRWPTLNLVSVFLTGGRFRLPDRNFARFLLMMFMIWCLIIRTCYQSKLFENLNNDMRHPAVKTFAEFNERNFTILISEDERADWTGVNETQVTVRLFKLNN